MKVANLIRIPLIALLIATSTEFYLRHWEGPPISIEQGQSIAICEAVPGCKEMTLGHRYDAQLRRKVVVVKVTAERKAKNPAIIEAVAAKMDEVVAQQPWYKSLGWDGRRVEVKNV